MENTVLFYASHVSPPQPCVCPHSPPIVGPAASVSPGPGPGLALPLASTCVLLCHWVLFQAHVGIIWLRSKYV